VPPGAGEGSELCGRYGTSRAINIICRTLPLSPIVVNEVGIKDEVKAWIMGSGATRQARSRRLAVAPPQARGRRGSGLHAQWRRFAVAVPQARNRGAAGSQP